MKLGKRVVSLLVSTAIAVTSLIPINLTAFAADPDYQYYNDLNYPDAGAVNLEKTATLVEDTQNQWDIQLKVEGKNMPSKPTDVVLVIDTSGSMNFSAGTTDDLLVCNKESHQHSDSCLGCGLEEHTHTAACCSKELHSHSTACYNGAGGGASAGLGAPSNPSNGYVYRRSFSRDEKVIYINGAWYSYTGSVGIGSIAPATCGKEQHTHRDGNCNTEKCDKVAHRHSASCYICGKSESNHTHRVNTNDPDLEYGEYCYKSRMQVAKEAYEAFLTQAALSTVSLQFGVVSFASYEKIEQELTTDIQAVKDSINGLTAGGGTNIHGGIRKAQKMLEGGREGANKIMIVLSDGLPTYAYDSDGDRIGNGSDTTSNVVTATKNAADAADAAGIDIYTIGYNLEDDSVLSYCGKDGYYSATGSGLTATLLSLVEKLVYAAEDAFVIDPMGEKFNLNIAGDSFSASDYTVTPAGATVTYNAETETLRWNIGKVVEGQTITLTYRVTIDDDAVSDVYYPTNGQTTMYYTDAKDRDAAKDFVVPEVQIGKGTITVLGYLVNDQGQPISRDGRVVETPEQAFQIYTEQGAYSLGQGQVHTILAKDQTPTYELAGEASKQVSLTLSHPTEKVYFQYKIAPEKGNIKVEYFYETQTGEVKVGEDAIFTGVVDTPFEKSSIDVSKNRNDIPAAIRDNYDQGTIETSPVPSKFISGTQIVKVLYRHAKGNVVVRYYNLSNNSEYLGEYNYMTDAFVGTPIDTSKINMNAFKPKPDGNYNDGKFMIEPATTVSKGTTYIDIGYTKIEAGLTVNYVFIGGERPSNAPENGKITVNKGDVINVDEKVLDFSASHYSHVNTKIDGGLTYADGQYTMTGTSAIITITSEMEKVSVRVDHKYNPVEGEPETITEIDTT
ncbi:MAG: VWA domain-containing protein, partial [Clostridiales bacterium]|nr:VWA domain-containing protein [Clostridiales bacterium]